jgi:hypothetical protein
MLAGHKDFKNRAEPLQAIFGVIPIQKYTEPKARDF